MPSPRSEGEPISNVYTLGNEILSGAVFLLIYKQGAVGIAGVVAAIYPIVSPGGYQMYGRTLPAWQEWGKGPDFALDCPWFAPQCDEVHFEPVTESQYIQNENELMLDDMHPRLYLESNCPDVPEQFQIEGTTFSTPHPGPQLLIKSQNLRKGKNSFWKNVT
ncbi:hypothetical protein B0H11DRAFT_1912961 [Mycena galericulata]|nr:hypothetical protein B0H11DRAFT_1912961 [Mycena galericulata]